MKGRLYFTAITLSILLFATNLKAQDTNKKKERTKEFYFSWGYNTESYTRSNIKIDQPGLGNNFVLKMYRHMITKVGMKAFFISPCLFRNTIIVSV
ncbi:MAG: hypothetical protein WDM71_10775 [Ferruginibacter sp.]